MWMISHPIRLAFLLFVVMGIEVSRSHAEQSELLGARMPYTAFDALPKTQLEVGGAKLDVAFAPGAFVLPKEKMLAWVERSATAVSVYYGRFPVPEARILIVPVPGKGVRRGTAFGYRGPAVRLAVGTESSEADLQDDWKAVHEMIHLALPDVTQDHLWLAEGHRC